MSPGKVWHSTGTAFHMTKSQGLVDLKRSDICQSGYLVLVERRELKLSTESEVVLKTKISNRTLQWTLTSVPYTQCKKKVRTRAHHVKQRPVRHRSIDGIVPIIMTNKKCAYVRLNWISSVGYCSVVSYSCFCGDRAGSGERCAQCYFV